MFPTNKNSHIEMFPQWLNDVWVKSFLVPFIAVEGKINSCTGSAVQQGSLDKAKIAYEHAMFRSLSQICMVKINQNHIPLLLLKSSRGWTSIIPSRSAAQYQGALDPASVWLKLKNPKTHGQMPGKLGIYYTYLSKQGQRSWFGSNPVLAPSPVWHDLTIWCHLPSSASGSSIIEILTFVRPCPQCFSWPLSPASVRWGESCCIVWQGPTYRKLESFTRPGKDFPHVDLHGSS